MPQGSSIGLTGLNRLLYSSLLLFFFSACSTSPEYIKEALNKKAKEDLTDILNEMKVKKLDSLLLDNPSYTIVKFISFSGDTARMFEAAASVDFFYLKNLNLKQTRKYRFKNTGKFWDRYSVELKHVYSGSAGSLDSQRTDSH